jgi:hypothetical protein
LSNLRASYAFDIIQERQSVTEEEQAQKGTDEERADFLRLCLHACYTADNHANLGDDLMRLLLHLSREPMPAPARTIQRAARQRWTSKLRLQSHRGAARDP